MGKDDCNCCWHSCIKINWAHIFSSVLCLPTLFQTICAAALKISKLPFHLASSSVLWYSNCKPFPPSFFTTVVNLLKGLGSIRWRMFTHFLWGLVGHWSFQCYIWHERMCSSSSSKWFLSWFIHLSSQVYTWAFKSVFKKHVCSLKLFLSNLRSASCHWARMMLETKVTGRFWCVEHSCYCVPSCRGLPLAKMYVFLGFVGYELILHHNQYMHLQGPEGCSVQVIYEIASSFRTLLTLMSFARPWVSLCSSVVLLASNFVSSPLQMVLVIRGKLAVFVPFLYNGKLKERSLITMKRTREKDREGNSPKSH